MMNDQKLQTAIEEVILGVTSPKNGSVETVRKLIGLFAAGDRSYSDPQLEFFDEIFDTILSNMEESSFEVLSEYLAATEQAPPKLLQRFALNTAAPVAGPVLRSHPAVPEAILVEVAETRSDDHLQFLSQRENIPAKVTTPLVNRGSETVLSNVIDNPSASFSETGIETLVERSSKVDTLALKLSQRDDLPTSAAMKLLTLASDRIKEKFKSVQPDNAPAVDAVVDAVADKVSLKTIALTYDFHAGRRRFFQIKTGKAASKTDLMTLVSHEDLEACVVVLGDMANIALERVALMIHDDDFTSITALLRALDLNWNEARQFMSLRARGTGLEANVEKVARVFSTLDAKLAWSIIDAKCYAAGKKYH